MEVVTVQLQRNCGLMEKKCPCQIVFFLAEIQLSENGTYKCELRSRDKILSSVKHRLTIMGESILLTTSFQPEQVAKTNICV